MPNILDAGYGIQTVASKALENSHVLITPATLGFGGPFNIGFLQVFNFDTGTGYLIHLFDSATLPANGAVVPIYTTFVGVATSTVPAFIGVEFFAPRQAKLGIVVAGSTTLTTPFSLAVATANQLVFMAQVIA